MKNKQMRAKLALALATSLVGSEVTFAVSMMQRSSSTQISTTVQGINSQTVTTSGQLQVISSSQTTTNGQLQVNPSGSQLAQITQDIMDGNKGQKVQFEAVVSWKSGSNIYVQTEDAGIVLYKANGTVKVGDKISVEGTTNMYNNTPQITNGSLTVLSSDNNVEVIELTVEEYVQNKDIYQSRMLKFKDVELEEINTSSNTTLTDATGTINIYQIPQGIQEGASAYDVIALGTQTTKGVARLTVREAKDVIAHDGIGDLVSDTISINIGDTLVMPTIKVFENGIGQDKEINWNQNELAAVDTNKMGIYTVTGSYGTKSYTVKVYVNSDKFVPISEIQGASHTSPLLGFTINETRGVVTYVNGNYGFYIQSLEADMDQDDKTSEGLYISSYKSGVSVGDIVTVKGTVQEYAQNDEQLSVTQLADTSVTVESSGNPLPDAVIIGEGGRIPPNQIIDNDGFSEFDPEEDSIDFYESLEGMRIQIDEGLTVGAYENNMVTVVPNKGEFSLGLISPEGGVVISEDTLHPEILTLSGSSNNSLPEVEVGDIFVDSVSGVMTYQYGIYKMLVDGNDYQVEQATYDKNPQTTLTETENGLRVASYNVYNLAGTDSQEKYDGIGRVIAHNLLLPDIIGLEEVQDNDGTVDSQDVSANIVYERIIEAIKAQPGAENVEYDYVQIDPQNNKEGGSTGANIRIGILYRKDRVQLADGKAGDSTTATEVLVGDNGEAKLSLNPGRIEPMSEAFEGTRKSLAVEFTFNGEQVFIIGNHFNSKREDDAVYGSKQPAQLNSESKRIKQAEIVNNFIQDILAVNPKSKIVVFGDMNDHHYSNPLKKLAGDELYNMLYKLPENERYTYIYQGRSQVLDNLLINKELEECTEIEIIHVNTMHSGDTQLSDHDPVLIQIDMKRANEILNPVIPPSDTEDPGNTGDSENTGDSGNTGDSENTGSSGNTGGSGSTGDSDDDDGDSSSSTSSATTTNKTGVVIKEESNGIKVTCSSTFVTNQATNEKVVYEANLSSGKEAITIDLEANAVNKLIEVNKDFTVKLDNAEITVPCAVMKKNEKVQLSVELLKCTDKEIKEALPDARDGLVAYDLTAKVNNKENERLSEAIQIEMEIPSGANINKVGIYVINDGKWEYVPGTLKDGKIVAKVSNLGQIVLAESMQTFSDIQAHWAQEEIEILAAKHLVIGMEKDIFGPKSQIKAGDFATLLNRLVDKEITVKEEGKLLTRAEMAVMLKEALDVEAVVDSTELTAQFRDVSGCSTEEKQALAYLYNQGILLGQTTSKMAPNQVLTRAEMAVVINRVLKLQ